MSKRILLFLQGPTGPFFHTLGKELRQRGHKTIRVNSCGGDFLDWPAPCTRNYQGRYHNWSFWIGELMRKEGVTDLLLLAEWRPRHREAIAIARLLGIKVHVFEDGYLRPRYIILEEGGVNGASPLPREPDEICGLAAGLPPPPPQPDLPPKMRLLVWRTIASLAASFTLFPLFPFFRTHRPISSFREYILGWLPRLATKKWRMKESVKNLNALKAGNAPFFLFPLQLTVDAQVHRFSPFSNTLDSISHVLSSFARHAPASHSLLIKNHPLDCGLVKYGPYIKQYASALGIPERVYYVQDGNGEEMIRKSDGLVMLNSTMGLTALLMGKPVYYLGSAVCGVKGLGAAEPHVSLDGFWQNPTPPDMDLLHDFMKVMHAQALLPGDFLTPQGRALAISGVIRRLGL